MHKGSEISSWYEPQWTNTPRKVNALTIFQVALVTALSLVLDRVAKAMI